MSAIDNRYHAKIAGIPIMLARSSRLNRHLYVRDEAPSFVNKFSNGEPNYRDGTFFSHWVQLDWLNGFNQEFFDDGAKFFRSESLDTSETTKLQLEKSLVSSGLVSSGVRVNCIGALPGSLDWADDNYGYRKQLTITAPSGQTLPAGYPIRISEDTDALQTASKLQADRDDWKVYYYNGSAWVSLKRDYVTYNETWFALQASITAGISNTDYYIYYGYASESNNSEPTSDSEYNEVYGAPENVSNTRLLAHVIDTTGTNVQDTSGNGNDITLSSGASITNTDGKFSNGMDFESANSEYGSISDSSTLKPTGSFTIQMYVKTTQTGTSGLFQSKGANGGDNTSRGVGVLLSNGKIRFDIGTGTLATSKLLSSTGTVNDGDTHHVACTWDGATMKIFIDGVLDTSFAWTTAPVYASSNYIRVGCVTDLSNNNSNFFNGVISGLAVNNGTAITSFSHGVVTDSIVASVGSEVAKASATSTGGATIFVGCNNGKIYSWDGNTTWTEVKDTGNDEVYCVTTATFSSVSYLYFGSGSASSNTDGTAKLHRTADGSTFNDYTLTGGTTSAVLSAGFYDEKLFVGSGPLCRIYESDDGTTFTLSKDIDDPSNPGYPYAMKVYNNVLYVGGGSPEQYISSNTNGFLWSYDGFEWRQVFPFTFTVVKSLEVYDFVLFIGTVNKGVYAFNTASVDKLFEFPWEVSVEAMQVYNDKLMMALSATDESNPTGNEGIYVFDRNGIRHAYEAGEDGYCSLLTIGSTMMVGTVGSGYVRRVDETKYSDSGYYQSSYFEASLPTVDKLFRSITLFYDEMPTGCSIEMSWRTDESDSWTSLGTADNTGSTSEAFDFSSTATGKKVSLKLTLATSDNTKTPVLRKVVVKYVLAPDFKYIWKMTAVCPDNMMWLDGSEPVALVASSVTAGDTSLELDGAYGFVDPEGSTLYAEVVDSDGNVDQFSYTGISGSTLTGIPSSGTYALSDHGASETVRISGKSLHMTLKNLKESKKFYTYTDIDGVEYTVYFHSYQTDGWVIDQTTNPTSVEENEVPITLLEA